MYLGLGGHPVCPTPPGRASHTQCLPAPSHGEVWRQGPGAPESPKLPPLPFWKGTCQSWCVCVQLAPPSHHHDSQEKVGSPAQDGVGREQSSLGGSPGLWEEGPGVLSQASQSRPSERPGVSPLPRPGQASAQRAGERAGQSWLGCSLLRTLHRCCSHGPSLCFCEVGTGGQLHQDPR